MRTLLISALAASLAGCTCLPPPPQVMNEGTDQNGFACFGQTPVRPVIAPNPAVFQADPVRRKTRPPTVGKIDTPASTRHADKGDFVRKNRKPTMPAKMEAPASTEPADKAYSVTKKQKFTMPSKLEAPTSTEPADKVESVTKTLKSTIAAKMDAPAFTQSANDPAVLQKAMVTIAAKMKDSSAEFGEMKRAVRKNTLGVPIDTICGYVKRKNASHGDTEERPFLYLVQEDEAYIVDGSDLIAATAYRNICN